MSTRCFPISLRTWLVTLLLCVSASLTETRGNSSNTIASQVSHMDYSIHPIIAIGLPKSGTTSVYTFLTSLSPVIQSRHYATRGACNASMFPIPAILIPIHNHYRNITWPAIIRPADGYNTFCPFAYYIQQAVAQGRRPLANLLARGLNSLVQLDLIDYTVSRFPQLDLLPHILDAYPDGLYIHHTRNASIHASSILTWNRLGERLEASGVLDMVYAPPNLLEYSILPRSHKEQSNEAFLHSRIVRWILHARAYVRHLVLQRPGLRYVEVDLEEDAEAAAANIAVLVGAGHLAPMAYSNRHPRR